MTGCVPTLHWLPSPGDFNDDLARAHSAADEEGQLSALTSLAARRLDFVQTGRLDRLLAEVAPRLPARMPRLKLALLGSATLDHLVSGIRVGALRRGLFVEVWIAPFGQWRQQVLEPTSELHTFGPDVVLFAVDYAALLPSLALDASAAEAAEAVESAIRELSHLWRILRDTSRAAVIQQTMWSGDPLIFGHFDSLVPASPSALATRLDVRLAEVAAREHVVVLDLRGAMMQVGLRHVVDPALWHHAKQAVSPAAAPWAGEQVGAIVAALRGLSRKVLVLDLDNTLWGGTIGDDGLAGIVLGGGSAEGEAFVAFQRYVKRLSERGILLAISSKNDRAIVEAALDRHPEMVLRRSDFAAIEVDWNDKPSALRRIVHDLKLGLDALVFFDDNPVERALMRRELPAVAVPEVPQAPELYARCLADAGYFEAVCFTTDDARRTAQYAANRERERLQSRATDMDGFLRDLQTTMTVGPFHLVDMARIAQLVNKTNQFNLTTRRYTELELRALVGDPAVLTYAARVADRFGDNGLTSVVITRLTPNGRAPVAEIDTWLMSCRVLGRRIEHAMLSVIADGAKAAGAEKLVGRYRPTARNGMVKDLYPKLGFSPVNSGEENEESVWMLQLDGAQLIAPEHLMVVHT